MDRFGIEQVYGMHNGPGIPVGSFAIRPGPIMAATDSIDIQIEGVGGHAARPHKCIDSVLVGAQLINALQSIVSRTVDPLEVGGDLDVRVPRRQRPQRDPANRELRGTVRTLTPEVRDLVEKRVREVVAGVAQMTGAKIDLIYERGYPVTGQPRRADRRRDAGRQGTSPATANVHEMPPLMGAEDFAYMLEARPGAFIFCGNGDSAGLHHPAYNFNDDAIVLRHLVLDQAGREHAGGVSAAISSASSRERRNHDHQVALRGGTFPLIPTHGVHHARQGQGSQRSVPRHAERHLLRRKADPEGAAEDGQGRQLRQAARGVREASRRDRRPDRAAGADFRTARQAGARQDLRRHHGHPRRGQGDHGGVQGRRSARRRPARRGAGGRTLRDLPLRHAEAMGHASSA